MKFFVTGAAWAGFLIAACAANAQPAPGESGQSPDGQSPYTNVSDFDGPYSYGASPPPPPEAYGSGYEAYGSGYEAYGSRYYAAPALLPPTEVYAVLRENGFSPLGIPRQRGLVYVISALDRGGEDGRLVIDARDGRILRFIPANHYGARFDDDGSLGYGRPPAYGPPPSYGPSVYGPQSALTPSELPVPAAVRGAPRPPAPIPHVASRVPVPAPKPNRPAAESQQSASVQPKPAETASVAPAAPPAAPATVGAAKPSVQLQPTQPMPQAQGLD
jgi:hypothetical protein